MDAATVSALTIYAYVCFAIGALLIFAGILQEAHFFYTRKKYRRRASTPGSLRRSYALTLWRDPWLLTNPNMEARIGGESRPKHVDSFRDVDVNTVGQFRPSLHREESLTESQQQETSPPPRLDEECVQITYHSIPSEYVITRMRTVSDGSGRPVAYTQARRPATGDRLARGGNTVSEEIPGGLLRRVKEGDAPAKVFVVDSGEGFASIMESHTKLASSDRRSSSLTYNSRGSSSSRDTDPDFDEQLVSSSELILGTQDIFLQSKTQF